MGNQPCLIDGRKKRMCSWSGPAPHRDERTYLSITSDNLQLVTLSELPVSADRIELSRFLSLTADKHNFIVYNCRQAQLRTSVIFIANVF